MAEGEDKDQKTLDPTQKKLDDALQKGDVAKSQDLVAWFLLFASTLIVATMAAGSASGLSVPLKNLIANADLVTIDRSALMQLLMSLILAIVVAVGLPMLGLFLTGVGANLVQHRLVFSGESLKPKLSKISPLAGFKRIFGLDAIVNFVKGLAKILILGVVIFAVLWPQRGTIDSLVRMDVEMLLPHTFSIVMTVLIAVVAILTILALADFVYQYQRWYW